VLKELGITRRTFYRYVSKGLLASVVHGGRTLVPRASITDYWARLAADAEKKALSRRRSRTRATTR
jgi:excisionase family DNA binding protein